MKNKEQTLSFTGERFVPECSGEIELEHLHRYLQASQAVSGKIVLDIASGEGYGSALMAETALRVYGVDISQEAVDHANNKYKSENLSYAVGKCEEIPLSDGSVDVVVSFETIEHHDKHDQMMSEVKRILKPDGVLIISSPDRLYYSDEPGNHNVFHVKELYSHEFKSLLNNYFKNVEYFCQRVIYGSAIFAESTETKILSSYLGESIKIAYTGLRKPLYLIAICSDVSVPKLASGLFEQAIEESEIAIAYSQAIKEQEERIGESQIRLSNMDERLIELSNELNEKTNQVNEYANALKDREVQLEVYRNETFNLKTQLEEKSAILVSMDTLMELNNKKLANFQMELINVRKTWSWRITAPLRKLRAMGFRK